MNLMKSYEICSRLQVSRVVAGFQDAEVLRRARCQLLREGPVRLDAPAVRLHMELLHVAQVVQDPCQRGGTSGSAETAVPLKTGEVLYLRVA